MNQEFVRSLLAFGARPGDATTWAKVADFAYEPPGLVWVLSRSAWALGLLAVGSWRHGRPRSGPGAASTSETGSSS